MRLLDELVHLRMCGEVDDEIDLRVLDAVDATVERGVLAGQVLEQRVEVLRPRIGALVDPEYRVSFAQETEGQVRADLPGRAGEKHPHRLKPARDSGR